MIAGFLVVYAGGLPQTAGEYSVAVILLALVALLGCAERRGRHPADAGNTAPAAGAGRGAVIADGAARTRSRPGCRGASTAT
ncbi:hypothetical protein ACFYPH_19720 [Micromonospora sp. NPDC005252]|uniref:hypothetical protein n=1 Tax=unclassified Micromonospora TaxID=2617518 RepID=UPI0036B55BCF